MSIEASKIVDEVMLARRSVRGFLPTPVSRSIIEDILRVSAKAPSGSNIQPWQVYVVTGQRKEEITQAVLEAFNDPEKNVLHRPEYIYYPKNWTEPFLGRRRKVGYDLYDLAGIARGEHQKMHQFHGKNYEFFGAPVALMLTETPLQKVVSVEMRLKPPNTVTTTRLFLLCLLLPLVKVVEAAARAKASTATRSVEVKQSASLDMARMNQRGARLLLLKMPSRY
jgi:hypothetical protein